MGCYINPQHEQSKEEWLLIHGKVVGSIHVPDGCCLPDRRSDTSGPKIPSGIPAWEKFSPGSLPVVLISNGPFTAAAVAYCKKEYEEFTEHESDARLRIIYEASISDLLEVSDLQNFEIKSPSPTPKSTSDEHRKILWNKSKST
jgi:hypothetical protein